MKKIDIRSIISNPLSFPWELTSCYRPKAGRVHSYLCDILSDYEGDKGRSFFKGNPTLSELKRYAKIYESDQANSIVKYCEKLYNLPNSERDNIDLEVLRFLNSHNNFVEDLTKTIYRMYYEGSLIINSKYLYNE